MKRFLLFAVAILAFVGCDNKFEDGGSSRQMKTELPTLIAGFEGADTRTYVEDNRYLHWHGGELISVFYGNTVHHQYKFDGMTGDTTGTFSYVQSIGVDDVQRFDGIYSLYPYDVATEIDENGVLSYYFSATQEYAEKSFGKEANVMVTKTENIDDIFLAFKNVGGYLKIKLYGGGTVKSIVVKGNNGEKIAGQATITTSFDGEPKVVMADDALESITLDCGEGVKLSTDADKPTEFWIVIPPVEFSKGITLVAYSDRASYEFTKKTDNPITIERNQIQPMKTFRAEFYGDTGNEHHPSQIPDNEIWYTTNSGKTFEPRTTTGFGANIISNTYDDDKGVIEFDGPVTTIPEGAFTKAFSITSVVIPHKVTEIGSEAFYQNIYLASVSIGDGVKTIGDSAFSQCSELESVYFGESVETIGNNAFYKCGITSLVLPDALISIGDAAFKNCSALTTIDIPDNVQTIGTLDSANEGAFSNCSSLKRVTIGKGVKTIGNYAFYRCASLTNLTIGSSVETIGDYAFYECNALIDIDFPNSLKNIEQWAFGQCSSLRSIVLPNSITEVKYHSFAGCSGVTKIVIPDSITYIDWGAFSECSSVTNVTIPESVTSMGPYVFLRCYKLKTVVCERTSPPTIDSGVFYDCSSDLKIYVPDGSASSYRSSWSEYKDNIVGDGSDDDGGVGFLPSIGDGAVIK